MNTPDVETRLAEIAALLAAAAEGEWTDIDEPLQPAPVAWHTIMSPRRRVLAAVMTTADAALITRAPAALRFLLAEVQTMRTWAERAAADENANAAELAQAQEDLANYERIDALLRRNLMAAVDGNWAPSEHIVDSAPCWADVIDAARVAGARSMHKAVKRALIVEDDEDANDWLDARERVRALDPEAVAGSVDFAVIAATRKRQGVYVASRERHAMWWRQLRVDGIIPITSTWFDESSSEFTEAELCRRIPVEISQSTMLVVYVEPADLPMMFVEVGMALALGLRVFVAAPGVEIPALGSWIWSRNVTLCADLEDAVRQARSLIDAWENA